jgi:hypothetical protein
MPDDRTPWWRSGKHLRRGVATIAVPILVVVLLNLGLYTQLAPKPPQSLYGSAHRASLIQMSLRDWIVLGGRWQRRDVMISQENDQPEDLGIIAPLRMAPGDAFRVSVGLWLEQEAQGGGILFDVQRPTSHLGSQLVRLGRDELGTYVLCGYFDANNVLQVQANERVTGQPDLTEVGHLSIVVGPTTYSVLVGDQPVLRDLPRMASGGWVGLDAQGGPVVFSDAQIDLIGDNATTVVAEPAQVDSTATAAQPTPAATMRLPYQADFSTALEQTAWRPLAGQWTIDNGALVQQRSEESDDSVTLEDAPGGDYTIRARCHHVQGMGGGV